MSLNITGTTKIFRHENDNGVVTYSRCISSRKYVNGEKLDEFIRTFERVQLPKGSDVPDKTTIDIKRAFEACNEYNGKVYRKLIVQEYNIVDNQENGFKTVDEESPF